MSVLHHILSRGVTKNKTAEAKSPTLTEPNEFKNILQTILKNRQEIKQKLISVNTWFHKFDIKEPVGVSALMSVLHHTWSIAWSVTRKSVCKKPVLPLPYKVRKIQKRSLSHIDFLWVFVLDPTLSKNMRDTEREREDEICSFENNAKRRLEKYGTSSDFTAAWTRWAGNDGFYQYW